MPPYIPTAKAEGFTAAIDKRVSGYVDLKLYLFIHSFHDGGKDGIMQCKVPGPILAVSAIDVYKRQARGS